MLHILFVFLDQQRAVASFIPFAQHGEFFIMHRDVNNKFVVVVKSLRGLSDIVGSI
jgi:hypothetical protein